MIMIFVLTTTVIMMIMSSAGVRGGKDMEAPIFLNDDFASALDVLARSIFV